MNRDAFLARIRAAADSGRAYRIHSVDDPATSLVSERAGNDTCQRMADEAQAAGGQVWLAASWGEARHVVGRLLDQIFDSAPQGDSPSNSARSALCWRHPALERINLDELLQARDVDRVGPRQLADLPAPQQRAAMMAAAVGITGCTWAVAETGTLVMASQPDQPRGASLLPPVHITLIAADQILPDLFDLFAQLPGGELPSNLVLITGPSKTGDIELQLTTGVHGPGIWQLVIVREPLNGAADDR